MQLNRLLRLILSLSDGERRPLLRRSYQATFSKSMGRVMLIPCSPFEWDQNKLSRRFA